MENKRAERGLYASAKGHPLSGSEEEVDVFKLKTTLNGEI